MYLRGAIRPSGVPAGRLYLRRAMEALYLPDLAAAEVSYLPGVYCCMCAPHQLIVASVLAMHQVHLALLLDALVLETLVPEMLGQDVHQAYPA